MEINDGVLRDFVERPARDGRKPRRLVLNRADLEQAYGPHWERPALTLGKACVRLFGYTEFEISPEDPTCIVCLDATVYKLDPEALGPDS